MIGLALAARVRARHRRERLGEPIWEHPAIAGKHAVATAVECVGSEVQSVATCQCTWRSRVAVDELADQARAIDEHWRDVIACHEIAA